MTIAANPEIRSIRITRNSDVNVAAVLKTRMLSGLITRFNVETQGADYTTLRRGSQSVEPKPYQLVLCDEAVRCANDSLESLNTWHHAERVEITARPNSYWVIVPVGAVEHLELKLGKGVWVTFDHSKKYDSWRVEAQLSYFPETEELRASVYEAVCEAIEPRSYSVYHGATPTLPTTLPEWALTLYRRHIDPGVHVIPLQHV